MRVIIDGTLELDLSAPPRVGEIIAWGPTARRVHEVVWWIPTKNREGNPPTGDDVSVHIRLEEADGPDA